MKLSIRHVSPKDSLFHELKEFRNVGIGDNPAGEADYTVVEERRDLCSYHMAYFDGDKMVGGIRLTPIGHGVTFSERITNLNNYFANTMETFDANRLVLDPSYRGGNYLKYFLFKTSSWMLENTSFNSVSVICRGQLRAIYENIGGVVVAEKLPWQTGNKTSEYTLISIDLRNVNNLLNRRVKDESVLQNAG